MNKNPSKTISDFGDQWTRYQDNDGFYGSQELFADMITPLLSLKDFKNKRVIDIGSGTGRIVQMLLNSDARQVIAVEPSDAFEVLEKYIQPWADRVTLRHIKGEDIPEKGDVDFAVSYGVLHHIPDPQPTMFAVFRALKPGGRFFAWVYGAENNGLYLSVVLPLRAITRHLPHVVLNGLVWIIDVFLCVYMVLCKIFPLPLHGYIQKIIWPLKPDKRRLVIYDQLNPEYAKYYTQKEIHDLFYHAGFRDIRIHHRHQYSWSIIGTKPQS